MGSTTEIDTHDHPIIFFDGVCNLCNSSVNFIIDRDPASRFRFASLQSDFAKHSLKKRKIDTSKLESIILWKDNKVYTKSDAAIEIAKDMMAPWSWLRILNVIPLFIRDSLYNWIAKNRYRWFGRRDKCRIPSPELKNRFLDS